MYEYYRGSWFRTGDEGRRTEEREVFQEPHYRACARSMTN